MRTILLAVVVVALLAGCGGSSRTLGDGQWYGKLTSVDVSQRRLEFAPACRLVRPGGNAAAGHGQSTYLRLLAGAAAQGPNPDSPPGWFVTVRNGAVTFVAEDSGLRSSGKADKRAFACVWSRRTQAFVK